MKKAAFLFALLVAASQIVYCQSLNYRWLNDLGNCEGSFFGLAAAGTNGNAYMIVDRGAGRTIERYDSSGALMWSQHVNNIWKIAATPDNNVLLGGIIWGTVTIGSTTLTSADTESFLVLIDENGYVINYAIFENYYTTIHSMKVTANGDIYVKGTVSDTLNFNGYLIVNNTPQQYTHFVMKLDKNLQPKWHHMLNVRPTTNFGEIAVHNSDVYLTGVFNDTLAIGSATIHQQTTGKEESFLIKMNPQGQIVWHKTIPAYINTFSFDADGNMFIVGGFHDTLTIDSKTIITNACHYQDCWNIYALKLDTSRQVAYLTAIEQNYNNVINSTAVSPEGNLYFTGELVKTNHVGSDSICTGSDAWESNTFLARLDVAGNLDWHVIPDQDFAIGAGISINGTGDLYWWGMAREFAIGADTVKSNQAYLGNYFLARYAGKPSVITSSEEAIPERDAVSVYPNPSDGPIFVKGTKGTELDITIYDTQGKCSVACTKLTGGELRIEGLMPGIYMVRISSDNRTTQKKLLIR